MVVEYLCSNCNYRFKRQSDATVPCCPYCSKTKTLRTVNRGPGKADALVKSS